MFIQLLLILYISLTLAILYIISSKYLGKKINKELLRYRGENVRIEILSKLYFILKVVKIITSRPSVLLIVLGVILFMIISAEATTPSHVWYEVKTYKDTLVSETIPAIIFKFNEPVSTSLINDLYSSIKKYLHSSRLDILDLNLFLRVMLDEPITIDNRDIYVVVGVDSKIFKEILNLSINDILKLRIVDDEYLIPTQGYIGPKPIFPPLNSVYITSLSRAIKILRLNTTYATEVVISLKGNTSYEVTNKLLDNIANAVNKHEFIERAYLALGNATYAYSRTLIPSINSFIIALLTSTISAMVIIAILSSLIPELLDLYRKLMIIGLPPWGGRIIAYIFIFIFIMILGIITLSLIYLGYGPTSTFNSLITFTIVSLSSLAYITKVVKVKELVRSESYIPVRRHYTYVVKSVNVDYVENVVKNSLVTNEFFDVEEIESKRYRNEVIIHSRLNFRESWGSGMDLNIILSTHDDVVKVYISTYPWGIEEISESMLNTMIALAISKIVGAIKSCILA